MKHKIVKKVILFCIGIIGTCSYPQQTAQYTQYMYNHSYINPAYAGSQEGINIFGIYRTQWIGLEGAPKTSVFSITSNLDSSGLGGGIHFTNERIGIMDENTIAMDLSYTIDLNSDYKLAFGLKGVINLLSVDYNKLRVYDIEDPIIDTNIHNKFSPNLGAGIFMYSDRVHFGISVPNFMNQKRFNNNELNIMTQKLHLYIMGGYVIDINDDIQFKPTVMTKVVGGAPLQVDLSANAMFMNKFIAGIAYRWDASLSGLVGFQIDKSLFVGYSYDADTSNLRKYNGGSHELLLKYTFSNSYKRINAPRFF